jgi:hypothetical protein
MSHDGFVPRFELQHFAKQPKPQPHQRDAEGDRAVQILPIHHAAILCLRPRLIKNFH